MSTVAPPRPAAAPPARPSLGRRAGEVWLRWWRRLTAMRTAIVLLFLLALAAIPGSLLPQRSLNQNAVRQYFADHPTLAPVLDRVYAFDVFGSPWFAAVYLLLFTSLIGCVLPRLAEHVRALRAAPPPAPRRLLRLPDSAELTTPLPGPLALDVVEEELRVRRFRVVRREGSTPPAGSGGTAHPAGASGTAHPAGASGTADPAGAGGTRDPELSAERGFWKETGNLLFHLSLVALLLGLAGGKLWGYEGSILVIEGQGFCNSFQQYDTYRSGALIDGEDLTPLCVDLEDFRADYEEDLTAASFTADVRYGAPGEDGEPVTIGVNDPLRLDGDRVYVTGHGYAPRFTVTLPDGTAFTDVSAPFLPADQTTLGSEGALKLPDLGADAEDQLAIEGFFAPTGLTQGGVLTSIDPRPLNPQVAVLAYQGYLGLDSGLPQSVYSLDRSQIERGRLSEVGRDTLSVGESMTLPDGTAITFTGVSQFAALQFSHDPGQVWVLAAAIALLAGLLALLLLRRERVFARVGPAPGGGTVLSVGSLTRGGGDSATSFAELTGRLRAALDERSPTPSAPPSGGAAPEPEVPSRDR